MLILIPVIISALYVLDIKAISDPAIAMLSIIFSYIPSLLAALVIIAIGWVLAKFCGNIITRIIAASGLDAKLAALAGTRDDSPYVLSAIIGKTVEAVMIIFFVVESFSTLHLGVLTRIGTAVIAYMPSLLTAVIILFIAFFLAAVAGNALKKNGHGSMGLIVRYVIYAVAAFMVLNQLGIARTLVDSTFILVIAAVAVAFAISFGIGGRDFAKAVLSDVQRKFHIGE